ncbi:MAG: NADH-quinone oxidoreductase subunit J [Pseudomonadota bacterium]
MLPTLVFSIFSIVLLMAALGVVFSRQAVHAALNLVLAFFSAACMWIMLDAEFLGLVLVLVYVGAVMVLFLFVLMMLDFAKPVEVEVNTPNYRFRVGIVIAAFMAEMGILLYSKMSSVSISSGDALTGMQWSVQQLALRLFNHYAYAFEVAGAILLFAMVAVIGLVKYSDQENSPKAPKRQNIADQVRVKKEDRLTLVKSS